MSNGAEVLSWIDALPPDVRAAVLGKMQGQRVPAGAVIMERYAPVRGLYRIVKGKVRLFSLSPDGREFLYKVYAPPENLGDLAAIDGEPYPLSAEALTDCELLFLSRKDLTELRRTYPQIETALLEFFVKVARSSLLFIEEASIFPLSARIASRLSFLASSAKARGEPMTELKVAQKDIGVMVGASRQAVNKVLADFQSLGLIETQYGAVRILDREGLMQQSLRFSSSPAENTPKHHP
ncbi:Crp/Fnr family transcriptional regulator [Hyphococcus luteus]|uniref:Crp/Fnr family transcriptional regulator n=1 Tax=Hyphococcus luteus TaxID=2058213 RepID=UPI0013FD116E|nr:Crp/Fnr family transcriptional regulator [Marinicaulis flavus]